MPRVVHVDAENRIVALGADAGRAGPGRQHDSESARGTRCGDGLGRAKSARAGEPRSLRCGSGGSVHLEYQLSGGAAALADLVCLRRLGQREGAVDDGAQVPAAASSATALMPAWSASTSITSARTPCCSASATNSSRPLGMIETIVPPRLSVRRERVRWSGPPMGSSTTSMSRAASVKSVSR